MCVESEKNQSVLAWVINFCIFFLFIFKRNKNVNIYMNTSFYFIKYPTWWRFFFSPLFFTIHSILPHDLLQFFFPPYPFTSIFHLISSTGAFIIHVVSKSVGFIEVLREKKEKRLMIGSWMCVRRKEKDVSFNTNLLNNFFFSPRFDFR